MKSSKIIKLTASEKIIINIGNNGAILTLYKKKLLVKRLFAASTNEYDSKEFAKLIELHPKAPISILIDTADQTYNKQQLPPVNIFMLPKLIRNRLKRDFGKNDFTGAIKLGRSRHGRRDWNYIFVSVPSTPPLSEWISLIEQFPNPINGFFLLPVELAKMCNNYTKSTKKAKPVVNEWKLLVVNNKISGLRQVVLKNNKIIFTRVTSTSHEDVPEIIAGEIEQELINTVDYVRRLTGKENITVSIILSLEEVIKQRMDISRIPSNDIHLLSPFKLASALKINNACKETDKFCDTLIAAHFAKNPHNHKIHTPKTQKLNQLLVTSKLSLVITTITLCYLLLHSTYNLASSHSLNQDIAYTQQQQKQIQTTWQSESEALGGYDISTATQINNIANLYRILSNNKFSPLNSISQLIPVLASNMQVNTIQWSLTEHEKSTKPPSINFAIELTLFNNESSIENLFTNFDQFIFELENNFKNYTVKYSRLPSTFKFNEENESIPIKINITGPKEK